MKQASFLSFKEIADSNKYKYDETQTELKNFVSSKIQYYWCF